MTSTDVVLFQERELGNKRREKTRKSQNAHHLMMLQNQSLLLGLEALLNMDRSQGPRAQKSLAQKHRSHKDASRECLRYEL